MQKVFNVLSVASFVMSAGLLGSSVLLYSRLPGMITNYVGSITGDVTEKVTEMIPEQIEQVVPDLPTETGLPIKFP
tara:strand:- start:316 stop:543 length:228 start_codon:yes stop_codon:yes gene_type:complete